MLIKSRVKNLGVKKFGWAIAVTAGVLVIGCGGGGSSSTGLTATTSGTGNRTGVSVATANLTGSSAHYKVTYLTGAARSAGDTSAHISLVEFRGAAGTAATPLADAIDVLLNGYTANSIAFDSPVAGSSQSFNQYRFTVDSMKVEDSNGVWSNPYPSIVSNNYPVDQLFDANITGFPGRYTGVQILLDQTMLFLDTPSGGSITPTLDRGLFLSSNTTSSNANIQGYLSDYVMFDISKMSTKVNLGDGAVADRIYFSGDSVAVSSSTDPASPATSTSAGAFEVFLQSGAVNGLYTNPAPPTNVGSYTLQGANPLGSGLNTNPLITSVTGIFRPFTQVINNPGSFEFMLLPHTSDGNQQDIVAFTEDASNNVTNLYYGTADLTAKTFSLFPITDLPNADTAGEVTGTLSGLADNSGAAQTTPSAVRQGTYTFTGTLPTGFVTTGRFFEFRE